jgi:hypothetical protein
MKMYEQEILIKERTETEESSKENSKRRRYIRGTQDMRNRRRKRNANGKVIPVTASGGP